MISRAIAVRVAPALVAFTFLSVATRLRSAQSATDSAEVSRLLSEAKTEAVQLKQDTEHMKAFARTKTSWQTHAASLDQIKGHVNELGKLVIKMNDAKAEASPWQQQSIDRITPLLQELAANVSSTIKHLNENQNRLMHPPYPDYTAASAEYASELSQLISDYVAYGEAKHKSEELTDKLEAPAK